MTTYLFKSYVSRIDFIKQHIPVDKMNMITKLIDRINEMDNNFVYNLLFIGPVGVGKSTLCTLLYFILDRSFEYCFADVYCYPEFLQIEPEQGHEMLQKHLNGSLTSREFQSYILHCWNVLMTKQPLSNINDTKRFNIFERCCDDSVICFANIWNQTHPDMLTDVDLHDLFIQARGIDNRHDVPSYFGNINDPNNNGIYLSVLPSSNIPDMIISILRLMITDIDNGITTRFIGLHADVDTLMGRVNIRNRPGERNGYGKNIINKFLRHYEILYEYLPQHNYRIQRYVDIGRLVDDDIHDDANSDDIL